MANVFATPQNVAREALRLLHQKLTFVGNINRQYDNTFAKEGAKQGSSLKLRLPNKYTVHTGADLTSAFQETQEDTVTLSVATQKNVGIQYSSAEFALSLDDVSKRILDPAMAVLAASLEADALSMVTSVYNTVANTGAAFDLNNLINGAVQANKSLIPTSGRIAVLNPKDAGNLIKDTKTLYNPDVSAQTREGKIGNWAGFEVFQTTHMPAQLRGTANASYVVNGASQTGSGVIVQTGTGTIKAGEIVTFAGCYAVHPETKVASADLQQFVVTADYAGGAGTISISPAIVTSGAKQNVSASPTNGGAVTVLGTASTNYGQSVLFHPDAFTLVTADLPVPKGVDFGVREVYDGISLRLVRGYDIKTDSLLTRIDVLYGYLAMRPELAVKVANQL